MSCLLGSFQIAVPEKCILLTRGGSALWPVCSDCKLGLEAAGPLVSYLLSVQIGFVVDDFMDYCVCEGHKCALATVWRSEDNFGDHFSPPTSLRQGLSSFCHSAEHSKLEPVLSFPPPLLPHTCAPTSCVSDSRVCSMLLYLGCLTGPHSDCSPWGRLSLQVHSHGQVPAVGPDSRRSPQSHTSPQGN